MTTDKNTDYHPEWLLKLALDTNVFGFSTVHSSSSQWMYQLLRQICWFYFQTPLLACRHWAGIINNLLFTCIHLTSTRQKSKLFYTNYCVWIILDGFKNRHSHCIFHVQMVLHEWLECVTVTHCSLFLPINNPCIHACIHTCDELYAFVILWLLSCIYEKQRFSCAHRTSYVLGLVLS